VPAGPKEYSGEAFSPSSSAKEEEEKILRELKDALRGVDPDAGPNARESSTTQWSTGKKLAVAGGAIVLIIVTVIGFELLKTKPPEPESAPQTAVEKTSEPALPPQVDDSARATAGKMAAILEAIEQYRKSKRAYPPSLTSLNQSYAKAETLKDGWGGNIFYLVDLTNKTFVLRSGGPDGKRGTTDDLWVDNDSSQAWLNEREQMISEWKAKNAGLYAQLTYLGPSPEQLKKLEAARQLEEEKKQQEAAALALAKKQEEQKRSEAARMEEEKRRQAEAKKREEELRLAKAREETLKRQQAARRPETIKDDFINGLELWDAPPTWEVVKDNDLSALRVQGLGFLKKGEQWDNYKVEFEVKVNRESAGWILRAQNSNNFYLFKLASDRAKAIPKNTLVKYIRSDDKYLNSLRREDAPGAAGVTPLAFKVRNRDYYKVALTVRGNTITHYIDGIQVDSWNDDTFNRGRFGFNASAIEQATIRSVSIEPLN
jgi:hypothetical protein